MKRSADRFLCLLALGQALLLLIPAQVSAQVPLGLSEDLIYAGTEIRVLQPGPDLLAIVAGIADAGPDRRYLVHLGPGVYDLSARLEMKPYVDLRGSGENVTSLRADAGGDVFSESGVVLMAFNSTLSDLTVENTATAGDTIVAVLAFGLDSVAAASGVSDPSTARLRRVTARASGDPSLTTRGIHLEESSIHMSDVTAEATGAGTNYGIRIYDASPTVARATAVASSGSVRNRAFYISRDSASPTLADTTAIAAGPASHGYYISQDAAATVLRSTIQGESGAVEISSDASAVIAQSLLEGGVAGSGFSCVANTDENGDALSETCEPIMASSQGH